MQQHGNKYFVRRPLPPLPTFGVGAFSEYDHYMQQHGSKYFAPPIGQNLTFSEYGHIELN